ncbi:hypothetical protein [Hyphomonas jannaschiana]|uniref:Lipoprotein n=1 Tax=Hyphomonas jannaschiana VP2 TaxID=1280952 RepID=A0A059F706_9PROT|nr:hypothetical protein [Hyphomonas jannaschiana]KCZ83871.1 hypothetical protein HJA_16310 [Hyphomonas jannaschiana VP2]
MHLKRIFAAASLAIAALLGAPALAEPAATCPADAEQTLYDMEMAIRQGTQTDLAAILELAEWAVETCPDRPDAQAIASTLSSAVMGSATDLDTLERYITLALTAITQNDYAWNTKQTPSVLKQPDGSEQNYFGYNAATTSLLKYALPYMIRLAEAGRIHPAISGAAYEACPFADHANFRLQEEANLWDRTIRTKYDHPGFGWAGNRLESLYAACPAHKLEIEFYLARLYGQEVERLTRWEHVYLENINFGNGGWIWTNPALPQKTYDDDSQMKEKKAELEAIARPLADKARSHIDVLMHTPDDQIRIYNGQLDKVRDWDKAVKKLDSEAAE